MAVRMRANGYRHLASKMRAIAATTSDADEKREPLLIAQRYDMLAERAATRGTEAANRPDGSGTIFRRPT